MSDIASNIQQVRARIAAAALRIGRLPEDVLLLAVSKTIPAQDVLTAAGAGQVHFAENRVQEAKGKIPCLPTNLTWHLVGHLQSNKTRQCPGLFSWIHSIDSADIAREVARRYRESGRKCRALVQVNVSGEASKSGCRPEEAAGVLSTLLEGEGAAPAGLMTIPPLGEYPEASRPFFAALRTLRDRLAGQGFPAESLRELSMGMSGDFEVAIEEGATIVRVGTAIFGGRGV